MKRAAVYSSSSRSRREAQPASPPTPAVTVPWRKRHARSLKIAAGVAAVLVLGLLLWIVAPAKVLTPADVAAMVQKMLDEQQPPPNAADAYEIILPSVVHVRGLPDAPDADVPSEKESQSGASPVLS